MKNIQIKLMKMCLCQQTMNVYCGRGARKAQMLNTYLY